MISEKDYDEIYQKGYEDGKNDNITKIEYALKPSFTTRKLKEQQNEIERLNNIIDKINKLLECDTHCENIYYAIGVLLNHNYFDIEDIENEEILNILKEDKQ